MKPLALLVIALISAEPLSAATLSVPLSPTVKTGADGDYLSADFDFGTAFSSVESIKLEFLMSDGYHGGGFNSDFTNWRSLHIIAQDNSSPITSVGALKPSPTERLQESLNSVSGGTLQSISFGWQVFIPEEIYTERIWPEFVTEGRGQLAFIDVAQAFFQESPRGPPVELSTSWQPPEGLTGPRLTIVGTPVPEPSMLPLMGIAAVSAAYPFRRRWFLGL